jgi:hypothetical protein
MGHKSEILILARRFASGRVTVSAHFSPPSEGCEPRYSPKVAGRYVRPDGMPLHGYLTREAARKGGLAYKRSCREWLSQAAESALSQADGRDGGV